MKPLTTPAGAMPVVASATLAQSYPTGPWFAAYRLPFPGAIGARDAGVCFEGEGDGGANPPAPPAPPANPPAPPADPPKPPATGDDDGLGDAGKRALAAERKARGDAEDRAKAAEEERDALKAATLSDTEKAVNDAKKAGADEVRTSYQGLIRSAKVEAALSAAGIRPSVMDLASKADEFGKLKVKDDGSVEGLDEAVAAFKKERGDLFGKASGDGTADGGAGSSGQGAATTLEAAIDAHYAGKA